MTRGPVGWVAGAITALAFAGCVFRTAEAPRFYRPASAAVAGAEDAGAAPATAGAPIRLQTVRSAPFLRERIVWRASPVEYGLYEQRRWFELPSRYVRRALVSALQTTPGVQLGDDPKAPRLDVEVLAFDEVLAPTHQASVALAVTVRRGAEKLLDRTFSAEAPIADADGAAMAEAMGRALDDVVAKVARAVAAELAPKPAPRARKK